MPSTTRRGMARALARGHLGALVAVVLAVFGGTAMITAATVLAESGITASVPPHRLAGADLLVSARQHVEVPEDFDVPLPERVLVPTTLAEQVATADGVAEVAADVTVPATLAGGLRADAHSWDVAALDEPPLDGAAPHGDDELVLDEELAGAAGLRPGDHVEVTVGGDRRTYRVSGVVDAPGSGISLDAATAVGLAGLPDGTTDLIAVRTTAGSDVAQVAAGLVSSLGDAYLVSTGVDRGGVERVEAAAARGELLELAGSLAGTLLLLVGCITAGALAISARNQRRDLALLRAVGATPRQVRRLIAQQATGAALIGLAPGIALGYPLAHRFADALTEAGMLSADLRLATTPYAALIVTALTVLVVQLAARGAAMRPSRMPSTEAMAESEVEPREPSRVRTVIGLVVIAAALGQTVLPLFVRGEAAFLSAATGTLVAVIGLALSGPGIARAVTDRLAASRWGDGTSRRVHVPTWLAVHNTRSYAVRTAGAVTVLALAIGLTITQFYALSTLARVVADDVAHGLVADATVTGQVSRADVADLSSTPGVEAVVPMVRTTVLRTSDLLGDPTTESYGALGLGPHADRVVDLGVDDGTLADLVGDTVALDVSAARSWDVKVGDRVDLVLGNGAQVRPRVVATYRRGLGFGTVTASTDLLAAHGAVRSVDTLLVAGDRGAVTRWAAPRQRVSVGSETALGDEESASLERWINLLVLLPMLGYVLVAAANSLVAATMQRRGEFSALRMAGATPRQIKAMVTREAAVLAGLAVATGFVLSVLPMSLLGLGLLGSPVPQGPWWVAPGIAALASAIALGSMRGAARRLLARPPLG
ncbi:FtsX-like permease family protein [Mumia sp. DW29H23]|uniref:ABC transporter permease n=1 Tax=Mumia sp. DW29H23 TaxID=3421241 RepID=UPI003D69D794